MNKEKKNYFRSEANHDEYSFKAKSCLFMLIGAWLYAYWDAIYITVSLYKYSPAGAHNSLLLIPCAWLLIYEQRYPKFLVPRFNYIGALFLTLCVGLWVYATVIEVYGAAHFLVYLMLPAIVVMCMGVSIAANNMVPIALWLLSFPIGHWLLQYIPTYLGDILSLIKTIFEATTEEPVTSWGDSQKKVMYVFWGSIQYLPISFSIILLYSRYRFRLNLFWQFMLLFITSILTFALFLVFSIIFSSISVENRTYLQVASFLTIFLVTIISVWYGYRIHIRYEESGPSVPLFEEGFTVSYKWFRKSFLMMLVLISGPWLANNINYDILKRSKNSIKLPLEIGVWEKQSVSDAISGFDVSFINTRQEEIATYKNRFKSVLVMMSLNDNNQGDSIVGNFKEFVDEKAWEQEKTSLIEAPLEDVKDFSVLERKYKDYNSTLVTWSWYYFGNSMIGDMNRAESIENVQNVVTANKVHKGVIVIAVENEKKEEAVKIIQSFTREFLNNFDGYF